MEDTTVEQVTQPALLMTFNNGVLEYEVYGVDTPEDAGGFIARCVKTFQGIDEELIETFEEAGFSHAGNRFTESFYEALGKDGRLVRPSNAKRGYIE